MKIKDYISGKVLIKERINTDNKLYALISVLGIIFILLNAMEIIKINDPRAMSVFESLSCCYIIIGIVKIIKNWRILKSEETLRKYEIMIKDERNIALHKRALSTAVTICVFTGSIIGTIFLFHNYTIAVTIFYSILYFLIIYVVLSYIFNKIM